MHPVAAADRAAEYLVEHARRVSGRKLWQGAWDDEFAADAERALSGLSGGHASLRFLAERRVRRVPRRALRGLFVWAGGFPVELRFDVPPAGQVLALQAAGRRCVSLLGDGMPCEPHASGLDFLVHDLCHLDKFAEPAHHEEQVGFFRSLHELRETSAFRELESLLDPTFVEDCDRLGADVNGSAVYLFALLKMKLKMAARRRNARLHGGSPRVSGALDAGEQAVFDELENALYACFGFDEEHRLAARATSARRDDADGASRIALEFRRRGRDALARFRANC